MPGHTLDYTPYPDQQPAGAPAGDLEHIQTSPEMFGGALGAAEQKLGQGVEAASGVGFAYQGMLNETMMTNAETQYRMSLGQLTGDFKSKEGLDAVNSRDQYVQAVANLRQQYRSQLPNYAAQRGFDLLALRHEGYAIQDAAGYAAQQLKSAENKSAQSSSAIAISEAGNIDVAKDDARFQQTLHDVDFATRRMMQNQGWGDYMHEDANHNLTFDDSEKGQQAKAAYTENLDKATTMAYKNRFTILADHNALVADAVFQRDRQSMPGSAQVEVDHMLRPRVRAAQASQTADRIIADTNANYNRSLGGGAAIEDAIHLQESGGKRFASTSVTGAMGGWQIQPETFRKYALPGEQITNPDDNERVGRRIISDLRNKFGDDPARIAVGYFSGEGNVAPRGNPTPWLHDWHDPNGKYVSSYVSDVIGRMGSSSTSPGVYQSQADYYRANRVSILDRAAREYQDDPQLQQFVVSKVDQHINKAITQQEQLYKVDADTVQRGFIGNFTQGMKPKSVDDLMAISPEVKQAALNMQRDNPFAWNMVVNRILTANAKETDHDVKTYGVGYYDLFKRVHSSGDDRITDPTQLYGHVGADGDLTVAGLKELSSEISSRRTPDGEAEAEMKRQFFKAAHSQISGTVETWGIKDPKGEELFLKFMVNTENAIKAGKAKGLTASQMYDKDSSDYLGKSIGQFKRNASQRAADLYNEGTQPATPAATQATAPDFNTPEGLIWAVHNNKISRPDAEKIAIQRGYIRATPPKVEEPRAPISQ